MGAHLGLRTHELLYEEIGNIMAKIVSAEEKADCLRFLLLQFKIIILAKHIEKSKNYYLELK